MSTSEMPPRDKELDGARRTRKPLVLAVNDNEAALYLTTLMLKRAGFDVIEARDGTSALALAEQLPAVIVLDVRLPDIDGIEVCRRIRANPKTAATKVLHTSATFVTLEKKLDGLGAGADGYLAQPFEDQELVATVHSLLRLSAVENQLRERADELVEASRRKDEFLAMLAHELRNPLSAVTAALPLLFQQDPSDDKESRARDIVHRQVRHLGDLVDDLLDVARVTRGKIQLQKQDLNLAGLVERVVAVARDTKVTPRRQTLELRLPDEPLWVHGDATRLEQVFANLLDNASKYTDVGGSLTVVVTKEPGGEHGRVRIRVCDSGMGMAPETVPSVFDLFSQAGVAIDRSRGGLGIGLTLVQTLLQLHGGTITATSAGLGQGSQFQVELSLIEHEVAQKAHQAATSNGRPTRVMAPRRVLLVEDNADARQMLCDLWETWGHEVLLAEDGQEAVEKALAESPDISFVDIGLPVFDGYEVARRIRKERGNEPLLVALTGYGSPEHKARTREAGFDHHLVKPVDPQVVRQLLTDLSLARATSRLSG